MSERHYFMDIDLYTKAASLGHLDSIARLGQFYQSGSMLKKDLKKSIEYLLRATNNGRLDPADLRDGTSSKIGYYYLAIAFENGLGIKRDRERAFEFYKALSAYDFLDSKEKSQKLDPFYYPGKPERVRLTDNLAMMCGDSQVSFYDGTLFNGPVVHNNFKKEPGRNVYIVRSLLLKYIWDFDAKRQYVLGSVTQCY